MANRDRNFYGVIVERTRGGLMAPKEFRRGCLSCDCVRGEASIVTTVANLVCLYDTETLLFYF